LTEWTCEVCGYRVTAVRSIRTTRGNKVPDSMPWILWNSPVEVRPRERAARPGSLREGTHPVGTPGNPEHQVP
jgi:hypothetical protein